MFSLTSPCLGAPRCPLLCLVGGLPSRWVGLLVAFNQLTGSLPPAWADPGAFPALGECGLGTPEQRQVMTPKFSGRGCW